MKSVLVTGGTGSIGRHAVTRLEQDGWTVHVLTRRDAASPGTLHRIDLGDRPAVRRLLEELGCSHLLHLAWVASHGLYWKSSENLDWVAESMALFRAFAETGGTRLVAAGTCAEYDWSAPDFVHSDIPETGPAKPHTLYGVAKLATQSILAAFAEQAGLSWAWGRVFMPFGAGEDPRRLVSSVIASLLDGRPALCSEGSQVRDFIDLTDVGTAFAHLIDSRVEGIVNIGSGQPASIAELALSIGRLLDRTDLIKLGGVPNRPDDPPRLVADISRLTDEVGFRPAVSLEEGLSRAIAALRSER